MGARYVQRPVVGQWRDDGGGRASISLAERNGGSGAYSGRIADGRFSGSVPVSNRAAGDSPFTLQ